MVNQPKNKKTLLRNLLRQLREESGLRQVELASKLKRPQSFVSKYESGEKNLSFLEVIDVCAALNVDISEVVKRITSETT